MSPRLRGRVRAATAEEEQRISGVALLEAANSKALDGEELLVRGQGRSLVDLIRFRAR